MSPLIFPPPPLLSFTSACRCTQQNGMKRRSKWWLSWRGEETQGLGFRIFFGGRENMAFAFSAAASPCYYSRFSPSLGKPYGHVFSANTVEFPLPRRERGVKSRVSEIRRYFSGCLNTNVKNTLVHRFWWICSQKCAECNFDFPPTSPYESLVDCYRCWWRKQKARTLIFPYENYGKKWNFASSF